MENNTTNGANSNATITIQVSGNIQIVRNRPVVTSIFIAAVLCFFLTFCDFRCTPGRRVASIRGIELVTGKKMVIDTLDDTKKQKVPPDPYAILAFVAGLIGCTVYIINEKRQNKVGMITGIAGVILLLVLQYRLTKKVEEVTAVIEVRYQFGYWCSTACLGIGALLSYWRLSQNNEANRVNKFDLLAWSEVNRKKLLLAAAGVVSISIVYFLYFSEDPERDAHRAVNGYCYCRLDKVDELVKDEKKNIDSMNFHSIEDAERALEQFYHCVDSSLSDCDQKNRYGSYVKRYAYDDDLLGAYKNTYNSILNDFNNRESAKIQEVRDYVRQKWQEVASKIIAADSAKAIAIDSATIYRGNEKEWQTVLSPQFRFYKEENDIPGQIERYRDSTGHDLILIAWGRDINADDPDSVLSEGLRLAFNGQQRPTKTMDGFYFSTGNNDNGASKYYYMVYDPKTMVSYALYSRAIDTEFISYSKKLIKAVRAARNNK